MLQNVGLLDTTSLVAGFTSPMIVETTSYVLVVLPLKSKPATILVLDKEPFAFVKEI